jgi:hypothetical protein
LNGPTRIGGKGRVDPTPRKGGIRDKLSFLLFLMKREEDPKTNISLFFIL